MGTKYHEVTLELIQYQRFFMYITCNLSILGGFCIYHLKYDLCTCLCEKYDCVIKTKMEKFGNGK